MKQHLFALVLSLFAFTFNACARSDTGNVGKTVPAAQFEYIANQASTAGKPYILEFWATWCPPCRQSIPHLNEVYAKYKSKGLVVVGVSNEDAATVKTFMKNMPMNYTVALEKSDTLSKTFGIRGIPHAMVVDKGGKIVWEGHPLELTDAVIEGVLK